MATKASREDRRERRTGTVDATDLEFAIWINKLWENGESPQKLVCVQVFKKGTVRGDVVHTEHIKPNTNWDIERSTSVANDILSAAQLHCERIVKASQSYYVEAYDKDRSADSYRKWPLDLSPKLKHIGTNGKGADDEDEESETDERNLALKYMAAAITATKEDKDRTGLMIGDMYVNQRDQIQEMRVWCTELLSQNRMIFSEAMKAQREANEAQNNALDREFARKREEFKLNMWGEVARTGRNMLQTVLGDIAAEKTLPANGGAAPANGTAPTPQPKRPSEIQVALDDFLHDCESTNCFDKIMGVWTETALTTPGVLTIPQCRLIFGVLEGKLPDDALDALMPDSGKPESLGMDQVMQAQQIMPDSVQLTFARVLSILTRKREARKTPQTPPAPPTTESTT